MDMCVFMYCSCSSKSQQPEQCFQCINTVRVLNFVVYKISWILWYPLIHKNLYTMKINT